MDLDVAAAAAAEASAPATIESTLSLTELEAFERLHFLLFGMPYTDGGTALSRQFAAQSTTSRGGPASVSARQGLSETSGPQNGGTGASETRGSDSSYVDLSSKAASGPKAPVDPHVLFLAKYSGVVPLEGDDAAFADQWTLVRYLREHKWDPMRSEARLRATLAWRRRFAPGSLRPEDVEGPLSLGNLYVRGTDRANHPLVYCKIGYNPYTPEEQIQYLVFILEAALAAVTSTDPFDKGVTWLVDFSQLAAKSPALKVLKAFLNILGAHYPGALATMLLVKTPFRARPMLTIGVPPSLRSRMVYAKGKTVFEIAKALSPFIHESQLELQYGGSAPTLSEAEAIAQMAPHLAPS